MKDNAGQGAGRSGGALRAGRVHPRRSGVLGCGVAWAALLLAAQADTVVLKSGQAGSGTSFRRQNNVLLFLMDMRGPDGRITKAERGVALSEIERVECEMPAVLKTAPEQLAAGKAAAALPQIAAAAKAAEAFGDLPGSWWPQLVALQSGALLALGRDAEAAALATALESSASPGLARQGKAVHALTAARKGDHAAAAPLASALWKEKDSLAPDSLAAVLVARGLGFLAAKDFVPALKSFLELPVFLPGQAAFAAMAELGAAEAYHGLGDYDRAIATLEALIRTRPGVPEVAKAQALLPEWQRRRALVNEAKAG